MNKTLDQELKVVIVSPVHMVLTMLLCSKPFRRESSNAFTKFFFIIIIYNTLFTLTNLLHTGSSHSLETSLVCLVHLWNLILVLSKLVDKLSGVQLAVGASCLDNLGLLLESEVLPCEVWTDVLLEKCENLVVGNGTWIGEVVDTSLVVLGKDDGSWKEIVEDGVGVWNVDNSVVLCDLGDKVTWVKIVADWHTETEDECILVVFHDLDYVSREYITPRKFR